MTAADAPALERAGGARALGEQLSETIEKFGLEAVLDALSNMKPAA